MARRRHQRNRGSFAERWWRRNRAAALSAAAAVGLLVLTAIVTPLGNRIVEVVWPAKDVGGKPQDFPDRSTSDTDGRLVALEQWPATYNGMCETFTMVAGLPGARSISELVPEQNEDVRITALKELGATIWFHGNMLVTLTSSDDTPLLIMSIEPIVFSKQDVIPRWGLEALPGCGGPSQMRVLRSVLDRGMTEDLGVSPVGPGNPNAPMEPFGPSFTVSNSDAADVVFEVNACEGLYDFGIKITYVEQGKTKSTLLGSPERPFRIVGGWRGVQRYHRTVEDIGLGPVRPGPLPLYPGAPVADGLPDSMKDLCT